MIVAILVAMVDRPILCLLLAIVVVSGIGFHGYFKCRLAKINAQHDAEKVKNFNRLADRSRQEGTVFQKGPGEEVLIIPHVARVHPNRPRSRASRSLPPQKG